MVILNDKSVARIVFILKAFFYCNINYKVEVVRFYSTFVTCNVGVLETIAILICNLSNMSHLF